jgi:elongation factor P
VARAVQIKKGNVIKWKDQLWRVTDTQQTFIGKRGAYHQMKLQNLADGHVENERFSSDQEVEKAFLEVHKMQYLYEDGVSYVFMDPASGDQVHIGADLLEGIIPFMAYNADVDVQFHEGKAISVELPPSVALEVTHTEPAVKGDTATTVTKPATLETGHVISKVPGHIKTGDRIRVDTRTGEFLGRA